MMARTEPSLSVSQLKVRRFMPNPPADPQPQPADRFSGHDEPLKNGWFG